jgi:hypothetical protein
MFNINISRNTDCTDFRPLLCLLRSGDGVLVMPLLFWPYVPYLKKNKVGLWGHVAVCVCVCVCVSFPINFWIPEPNLMKLTTSTYITGTWAHLNGLMKQEVLGRTNRLLSLIRHGPHWKRRVQQFFYCCVCIRYRGNVSTEPLPSNDKGIFTEPLASNDRGISTEPLLWQPFPSNDRRLHIQTQNDGRDF